jgi:hypothetical protein
MTFRRWRRIPAGMSGAEFEARMTMPNLYELVQDALSGEDHDDFFPWKWQAYVGDDNRRLEVGGISTPNGRRPDGTMHTYWSIAGEIWQPVGLLICEAVNRAAALAAANGAERRAPQSPGRRGGHHDGRIDRVLRRSSRLSVHASPTRLRAPQLGANVTLEALIDKARTPEFMDRLRRNMVKYKDLLDRLAEHDG